MDRRVKERLVGASILVVLIVLIVPELLSGPAPVPATSRLQAIAPEPVRSVTMDLRTSKAQATAPATAPVSDSVAASAAGAASPAAGSAAPSQAASGAESNTGGSTNSGTAARPSPEPAAAPAAAPAVLEKAPTHPTSVAVPRAAASGGHSWAVQLGSFVSRENADKLARQLKSQGFAVYVSPSGSGASLRYRVRVGPMADRGAATQTVAKLKAAGQVGSLVPPGP
jgi:DedD protein